MKSPGTCYCGKPATRYYKSIRACDNCIAIESQTTLRANVATRESILQERALYNETRTNAWLLKQTPPPAPPADALLSVAGYALYFWRQGQKMERAL